MKYITHISAFFLGLIFIVFGMNFFLKFLPVPTPPAGSPAAMFMGGMYASGFLAFVKVLEILGGLFVAIPQTRHLGLLILGPIIVNIGLNDDVCPPETGYALFNAIGVFDFTMYRLRGEQYLASAGMTPEQIAQLFQPFNRLGQEKGLEEGTGIGLVVCKRLVELMDGEIGVHSTVGEGSVFWIELGLTSAPRLAGYDVERVALAQSQTPDGTARRTLLYVEDNPAVKQAQRNSR